MTKVTGFFGRVSACCGDGVTLLGNALRRAVLPLFVAYVRGEWSGGLVEACTNTRDGSARLLGRGGWVAVGFFSRRLVHGRLVYRC